MREKFGFLEEGRVEQRCWCHQNRVPRSAFQQAHSGCHTENGLPGAEVSAGRQVMRLLQKPRQRWYWLRWAGGRWREAHGLKSCLVEGGKTGTLRPLELPAIPQTPLQPANPNYAGLGPTHK